MDYKVLRAHTRAGKFYARDDVRNDLSDLSAEDAARMVEDGILEPVEAKAAAKGKGKAAEDKAPE